MAQTNHFNPSIFYRYYFIKKGLFLGIKKYSQEMSGKMMDFGCGSKPYQALFNVEEYVGVDYQGEGHSHQNEDIDVFYDGKYLPFPDNHFDSIFSSEVFEHVFNLEEIIAELYRVLKPNGKILITCPFAWQEHEIPNDYARYTQFALRHMLEKRGFQILKIEKTGNAVTTVFQLFVRTILSSKFSFFLIPLFNMLGLLANKVIKENKNLYLNNILLAQKQSV